MSCRSLSLLALIFAALPIPSFAADVPVTYAVDAKAYKAVAQGDPLTFELYADNGCTNLLHTQVLSAGSSVRQEKVLVQKVKNQNPQPVKETRLHATLSAAQAAPSIFLKVTGAGIVPVAPACQPQAAEVPPESVPLLFVRNGNGVVLGQATAANTTCDPYGGGQCRLPFKRTFGSITVECAVYENGNPDTFVYCPDGQQFDNYLYYQSADCTGQALIRWQRPFEPASMPSVVPPVNVVARNDNPVAYTDAPYSSFTNLTANSVRNSSVACFPTSPQTVLAAPAQLEDISGLDVPPFTIAP